MTDINGMGLLCEPHPPCPLPVHGEGEAVDSRLSTFESRLPLLNVSVHHYTPEDFIAAKHTFDLARRDETILNLDHAMAPLGSESCGSGPLAKYLIEAKPMEFTVRLRPFS